MDTPIHALRICILHRAFCIVHAHLQLYFACACACALVLVLALAFGIWQWGSIRARTWTGTRHQKTEVNHNQPLGVERQPRFELAFEFGIVASVFAAFKFPRLTRPCIVTVSGNKCKSKMAAASICVPARAKLVPTNSRKFEPLITPRSMSNRLRTVASISRFSRVV